MNATSETRPSMATVRDEASGAAMTGAPASSCPYPLHSEAWKHWNHQYALDMFAVSADWAAA